MNCVRDVEGSIIVGITTIDATTQVSAGEKICQQEDSIGNVGSTVCVAITPQEQCHCTRSSTGSQINWDRHGADIGEDYILDTDLRTDIGATTAVEGDDG